MDSHDGSQRGRASERGQVLVLFGFFLVVLLAFVGLGIDLGFAYITQARLSKAVDAAALAGMNNYHGAANITNALTVAQATFDANFSPNTNNFSPGYVTGTPKPSITFSNTGNAEVLNVSATATNKTFFLKAVPPGLWKTLTVSDSAQATRSPLIMTLVLDHSYSMSPGCDIPGGAGCTYGGTFLPDAVKSFIGDFDQNFDEVAVVSFGSVATNEVPMTTLFSAPITTDMDDAANANNNYWNGYTCSEVGLTNALNIELANNNSAATPVKVVVFFTDGLANGVEAELSCPTACTPAYTTGKTNRWNLASLIGTTTVELFPTNVVYANQLNPCCQEDVTFGSTCCGGVYYPTTNGTPQLIDYANVQNDATNRCILVARQMQEAGMYVFCVGFNAATAGTDVPDPVFLQNVANDPANPNTGQYNPALPSGVALVANNGADIGPLFQLIAAQIELRLTH
jgi:Flp pilus assembly protein TadG